MGKAAAVGIVSFCVTCLTVAYAADPELTGHVTDENEAPVGTARVTVRRANPSAGLWQTDTDRAGAFSLVLPAAGDYLVEVERQGYYELKNRPIHIETALDVTLAINTLREVFQSVNVNEQPSPVDISQTSNEQRLTGTDINDILYPNSHSLRNSMKLMPGVVEDASSAMHFNGSSENQVQYVLNGFNITDPITNQFHTTLAVEGVRSMDYSSGRYSPEYGKGTAGVLAINTENGTDAFHYTATDFIPGLQTQQGIALGNWYPRVGFTGPIVRDRAWFSDMLDLGYNTAYVSGLPSGQNTRSGFAGSNLLHTQINLTPRNIVYADFLVNADNEDRVGLGALDPVSTTQTVDTRQYFGSIKDQFYPGGGSLLEFGYARDEFSNHQAPQGSNPYIFSPQGRSGNYFVTADQTASRDQGLVHAYLPQFHFAGSHHVEAGIDADLLHYDGNFHRTSYELIGLAGTILSTTSFQGSGLFGLHDTEMGSWLLDTWRVTKRVEISAGIRQDWDQLVDSTGWSPRIAVSWSPFVDGRTRVAGGFAVTHDAVPLDPFGRVLDQSALTTEYGANGVPAGPPTPSTFVPGTGLKLPRATNWTLSADHEFSTHLTANATFLRRRGIDGFDFINTLAPDSPPSVLPFPNGTTPGVYALTNLRQDNYDSFQVTVRQSLAGQHEWMASYTRSSAKSNAVLDTNTLVPLQIAPSLVPMPWDTPNRFLAWAYLPLPWHDWSIAIMADARTGFPFSIQDQTGIVNGPVDSFRYPLNFDLNLAIERMITIRGYRFALRGGVNNLTGTKNPTAVNNVIGSPQYLQFLGDEGRHFVVRIRFFGRAQAK